MPHQISEEIGRDVILVLLNRLICEKLPTLLAMPMGGAAAEGVVRFLLLGQWQLAISKSQAR
jgi:hypothetical protein